MDYGNDNVSASSQPMRASSSRDTSSTSEIPLVENPPDFFLPYPSDFTETLCQRICKGLAKDDWSHCLANVFLAINSPSTLRAIPFSEDARAHLIAFLDSLKQPFDYFNDDERKTLEAVYHRHNPGIYEIEKVSQSIKTLASIDSYQEKSFYDIRQALKNLANCYDKFLSDLANEEKDSESRRRLLEPKASLSGVDIDYYYISFKHGYQILCCNEFAESIRTNEHGAHAVAAIGGVYYKSNPGPTASGGCTSPIRPNAEHAVVALHQCFAERQVAAATTIIKISRLPQFDIPSVDEDSDQNPDAYAELRTLQAANKDKSISHILLENSDRLKNLKKRRLPDKAGLVQAGYAIDGFNLSDVVYLKAVLDTLIRHEERQAAKEIIDKLVWDQTFFVGVGNQYLERFGYRKDASIVEKRQALFNAYVALHVEKEITANEWIDFFNDPRTDSRFIRRCNQIDEESLIQILGLLLSFPKLIPTLPKVEPPFYDPFLSVKHILELFKKILPRLVACVAEPDTDLKQKDVFFAIIYDEILSLFQSQRFDEEAMSEFFIGNVLYSAGDAKFDNFILRILRDATGKISICVVAIDSDSGLHVPVTDVRKKGETQNSIAQINIRNALLLPPFTKIKLNQKVRNRILSKSPEWWFMAWASQLGHRHAACQRWLVNGNLTQNDIDGFPMLCLMAELPATGPIVGKMYLEKKANVLSYLVLDPKGKPVSQEIALTELPWLNNEEPLTYQSITAPLLREKLIREAVSHEHVNQIERLNEQSLLQPVDIAFTMPRTVTKAVYLNIVKLWRFLKVPVAYHLDDVFKALHLEVFLAYKYAHKTLANVNLLIAAEKVMKKLIIVEKIELHEVDNETRMGYVAVPMDQVYVKEDTSWPYNEHVEREIANPRPLTEVIGQVVEGILFERIGERSKYMLFEKRSFPKDPSKAIKGGIYVDAANHTYILCDLKGRLYGADKLIRLSPTTDLRFFSWRLANDDLRALIFREVLGNPLNTNSLTLSNAPADRTLLQSLNKLAFAFPEIKLTSIKYINDGNGLLLLAYRHGYVYAFSLLLRSSVANIESLDLGGPILHDACGYYSVKHPEKLVAMLKILLNGIPYSPGTASSLSSPKTPPSKITSPRRSGSGSGSAFSLRLMRKSPLPQTGTPTRSEGSSSSFSSDLNAFSLQGVIRFNLNEYNVEGRTPILQLLACMHSHFFKYTARAIEILLQAGANLEKPDSRTGDYPLDYATEGSIGKRRTEPFIVLINLGARHIRYFSRAISFIDYFQGTTENLAEAGELLKQGPLRNDPAYYLARLQDKLLQEEPLGAANNYRIQMMNKCKGYLQVFPAKQVQQYSLENMTMLAVNDKEGYYLQPTSLATIAYCVYQLEQWLLKTDIIIPSELIKVRHQTPSYQALIVPKVPGEELSALLESAPNSQIFTRLDQERLSALICFSMLINPAQLGADAYVVQALGEHGDKDRLLQKKHSQSFVTAMHGAPKVACILFCLDAMLQRVSATVWKRLDDCFKSEIDVGFKFWLQQINDYYNEMLAFGISEVSKPFSQQAISTLYNKLLLLKSILSKREETYRKMTHMDLLCELEPELGEIYQNAFSSRGTTANVIARFATICDVLADKKLCNVDDNVTPREPLQTFNRHMLARQGLATGKVEALMALEQADIVDIINHFDFSSVSLPDGTPWHEKQKDIFEVLINEEIDFGQYGDSLSLVNAAGLTDDLLNKLLANCTFPNALKLNISGCVLLTDKFFKSLKRKHREKLISLNISGCNEFKELAVAYSVLQALLAGEKHGPFYLPNLQDFIANDCQQVSMVDFKAPSLEEAHANNLPLLRNFRVRGKALRLRVLDLSGNSQLSKCYLAPHANLEMLGLPASITPENKEKLLKRFHLQNLQMLKLSYCIDIDTLTFPPQLASLILDYSDVTFKKVISLIRDLPMLTHLSLIGCEQKNLSFAQRRLAEEFVSRYHYDENLQKEQKADLINHLESLACANQEFIFKSNYQPRSFWWLMLKLVPFKALRFDFILNEADHKELNNYRCLYLLDKVTFLHDVVKSTESSNYKHIYEPYQSLQCCVTLMPAEVGHLDKWLSDFVEQVPYLPLINGLITGKGEYLPWTVPQALQDLGVSITINRHIQAIEMDWPHSINHSRYGNDASSVLYDFLNHLLPGLCSSQTDISEDLKTFPFTLTNIGGITSSRIKLLSQLIEALVYRESQGLDVSNYYRPIKSDKPEVGARPINHVLIRHPRLTRLSFASVATAVNSLYAPTSASRKGKRSVTALATWHDNMANAIYIISGFENGYVRVHSLTGQMLTEHKVGSTAIKGFAIFTSHIICALSNGVLSTISIKNNSESNLVQFTLSTSESAASGGVINLNQIAVTHHRAEPMIIIGTAQGSLRTCSSLKADVFEEMVPSSSVNSKAIGCMIVLRDRLVFSAANVIYIYDFQNNRLIRSFNGHEKNDITAMVATTDNRVITGSTDKKIHIWDITQDQPIKILKGHSAGITQLAIISARWLVSSSNDQSIRIWDMANYKCITELKKKYTAKIKGLIVAGDHLFAGYRSGHIRLILTVAIKTLDISLRSWWREKFAYQVSTQSTADASIVTIEIKAKESVQDSDSELLLGLYQCLQVLYPSLTPELMMIAGSSIEIKLQKSKLSQTLINFLEALWTKSPSAIRLHQTGATDGLNVVRQLQRHSSFFVQPRVTADGVQRRYDVVSTQVNEVKLASSKGFPHTLTATNRVSSPQSGDLYTDNDIETYLNAAILQAPLRGRMTGDNYRVRYQTTQVDQGTVIVDGTATRPYLFLISAISNQTETHLHYLEGATTTVSGRPIVWDIDKSVRGLSKQAALVQQALESDDPQQALEGMVMSELQEGIQHERLHELLEAHSDGELGSLRHALEGFIEEDRRNNRDLVDELYPCIADEPNAHVKIVFAYNRSQSHWLTGEFILTKQTDDTGVRYNLVAYEHDPYGGGEMSVVQANTIHLALLKRLREYDPSIANITLERRKSPYGRRQAEGDGVSCGVIVADEMIKLLRGETTLNIPAPHAIGTAELREFQRRTIEAGGSTRPSSSLISDRSSFNKSSQAAFFSPNKDGASSSMDNHALGLEN